ncbi:MAG TPA: SDR family NAD(P)-dependent oxidoreductase [Flavitalea sp.]|nr:SDR family NAD(P)-dependent oxidoreductase [Flavitalea sp.]
MRAKKNTLRNILSVGVMVFTMLSCQTTPNVNAQDLNGKYGLNTYNTPEVVEELQYIEKNIKPLSPKPEARILITGSTAGIGQLTAKTLIAKGYKVVVHARNQKRAEDAKRDLPEAEAVVIGDLSDLDQVKKLAEDINALGRFDVIIHNAGASSSEGDVVFTVNSLAPYILTSLVHKPKRLIYVSSDLHKGARLNLENMQSSTPKISYSETKLHIFLFAKAVARKWKDVKVNTITPGWVSTKMGGSNAPDNLRLGYSTLVWLAEGKDKAAQTTGQYFFQSKLEPNYNKIVDDIALQDALLNAYFKVTNVPFPGN